MQPVPEHVTQRSQKTTFNLLSFSSVEDWFGVKSWRKLVQQVLKRCRDCDGTRPVVNLTLGRLAIPLCRLIKLAYDGCCESSRVSKPEALSVFVILLRVAVKKSSAPGKY